MDSLKISEIIATVKAPLVHAATENSRRFLLWVANIVNGARDKTAHDALVVENADPDNNRQDLPSPANTVPQPITDPQTNSAPKEPQNSEGVALLSDIVSVVVFTYSILE